MYLKRLFYAIRNINVICIFLLFHRKAIKIIKDYQIQKSKVLNVTFLLFKFIQFRVIDDMYIHDEPPTLIARTYNTLYYVFPPYFFFFYDFFYAVLSLALFYSIIIQQWVIKSPLLNLFFIFINILSLRFTDERLQML